MAEATNKPTGTPAEFAELHERVRQLSRRVDTIENDERLPLVVDTVKSHAASIVEVNTRLNAIETTVGEIENDAPKKKK